MEPFVRVSGIAAPMLQISIDTDQIIPATFLGGPDARGYGAGLFANSRFRKDGTPNPEFVLNQEPYNRAQILLADRNFGCGSSRERAPKALREFGFRCVIAPSFGGIFFNNCFRNGLLPVEIPIEDIRTIADEVIRTTGQCIVTVDLETQMVTPAAGKQFPFRSPETLRRMLLQGIDEIDLTLMQLSDIEAFRAMDRKRRPWAYLTDIT